MLASHRVDHAGIDDLRLGDPDYFNTNQIGNLCAMAIFMAQFLASRKDGKMEVADLLSHRHASSQSKQGDHHRLRDCGGLSADLRQINQARRRRLHLRRRRALLIAAYWGLIGSYFDVYTTTGNQAETLTGRTAIWAYTLDVSLDKPWFGNGIDAMWKVFPPFGREMFEARHAENELLQQFFAYGVAGVIMLVGLYASLYRRILSLPKGSEKAILLSIMLFIIIRGLAEAEPFDLLLPLWMITLMSSIVEDARGIRASKPILEFACIAWNVRKLAVAGSPEL